MKLSSKLESVSTLLWFKLFGRKAPLAVRLQVTDRCANRCEYCNIWHSGRPDMPQEKVFGLIGQLAKLGTKKISFSGGEPLLREDIGAIISRCKDSGISPEMNSRGTLMDKRAGSLGGLDLLKISIDGPEDVHDFMSGRPGAYKEAVRALEIARERGIKASIATTITKHNVSRLGYILALAEQYGTKAAFQPLKKLYRGVEQMEGISPDEAEYRKAVGALIDEKKNGNPHMRNSLIGLEHIYNWPKYPAVECTAGKLFCIIDTDGTMLPCDRISYREQLPNCFEAGAAEAMRRLPEARCSGCGFCGSLELNFLAALRPGTISEVLWLTGKAKTRAVAQGR